MRKAKFALLTALSGTILATPAAAEWNRASTTHFVIYSEQSQPRLREFADRLERFDAATRMVREMRSNAPGIGNRLTIFVVSSEAAVRRLAQDKTGFVAGFYIPRASGSVAFVPQKAGTGESWDLDAQTILFHEYAHHLMLQDLDRPYPEWLVEGFAEMIATTQFQRDGDVDLGMVPNHRGIALFDGKQLPLEILLAGNYGPLTPEQRDSVYGRGWLLAHYLSFDPARRGQLSKYLNGIAEGVGPLDSARAAFGDLGTLERELQAYLKRNKFRYLTIPARSVTPGPIEVTRLTPGAGAVMPLHIELKRGVDNQTAEPLAAKIRAVVAAHPADPLVQATLAEAELEANHSEAAEAAADRALALAPKDTEAMILKGRAMVARAAATDSEHRATFAEARRLFINANKVDPEDPEPLMEYYKAFLRQGDRPTANAIEALHYASNLAPQDLGLRMNSAVAYLNEGKLKEARLTLVPVAYSPHGGEMSNEARRMIARIDSGDAKGALRRHRPEAVSATDGS